MMSEELQKEEFKPILVRFEHGTLTDEGKQLTKFKYLRSKIKKSNKRMLSADTGSLQYTGAVLQKPQSFIKYYVAVIDKKNNRIEKVEKCSLCVLKPKFQENVGIVNSKTPQTFRQKTDNLVEAFGSAKQQRLLSSRKKNEQVQGTISDKVAEVAKTVTPKSDIKTKETPTLDDIAIIPPKNVDATTVGELYHIDDVISYRDYQSLLGEAQSFIDSDSKAISQWAEEKKYPEYILHQLKLLPISAKERKERSCYLCYLHYLMLFFRLDYKAMRRKDPCEKIPQPIKNNMIESFCYSEKGKNRCVPKKYKDKQLCYILILSLIIEEFDLNCNLLMKDLKLGTTRISQLLRAIGCTVKIANLKHKPSGEGEATLPPSVTATLSLPRSLDKPPTPTKKREMEEPGTPDIPVKKEALS